MLTKMDRMRLPRGVMILGQRYFPPRPNIAFWRKEHFALPEAISGDRYIRHNIRDILIEGEKAGDELNRACDAFAKDILQHGERKVERNDVRSFVDQLSAPAHYWSTLESHFHDILSGYTLDRDYEDIRCRWLKLVRDSLQSAWRQHSASVSTGDAWAIRALVRAEGPVRRKLKELDDEIKKLEPQKEES
jgi:CRISPR system Cascade subunit CasA